MKVLFAGQVPKDAGYPESNEDSLEIDETSHRLSLSDGASESFDSKAWGMLLAKAFVESPEITELWLLERLTAYEAQVDPASLSWSKRAAYERGSFATLLGVEVRQEAGAVDVTAIGDSVAVLLDGDTYLDSFPYRRADEFSQRPELLSTNAVHNGFAVSPEFRSRHHLRWELPPGGRPTLLCMTDAIAEWALRNAEHAESRWSELRSIASAEALAEIVHAERAKHSMRVDDVSLVVIELALADRDELPNA